MQSDALVDRLLVVAFSLTRVIKFSVPTIFLMITSIVSSSIAQVYKVHFEYLSGEGKGMLYWHIELLEGFLGLSN